MVRIKDIAIEANVSEGTVDRVLHNRGGVSKKTEEKIRHIIERRNFIINPVASALATKNNHTIAVLIPEYNNIDAFWKLPYLGLLKASEDVKSIGVRIVCFKFNQYSSESYLAAFNSLFNIKPTAVILVPMFIKETCSIINKLKIIGTPYVFLNVDIDEVSSHGYVGQDSFVSGYIAAKLMALSIPEYSDCGILQTRLSIGDNQAIEKRIKGFKHYFEITSRNNTLYELKIETFNNVSNLALSIKRFLKKYPTIKGLFVPSSRISAVVSILTDKQKDTLRLIGFDNTPENVACLKNDEVHFLISQKPFDQGYEAVRILSDYLVKNKQLTEKLYLPIDILTKENVDYNDVNQLVFENDLKTN